MSKSSTPGSRARTPRRHRRLIAFLAPIAVIATGIAVVLPTAPSDAATNVGLGTATSFAVLAGTGITNTGPTTITGDVGTHPTPAEPGFGSVTLHGANHQADAVALQAKNDLTTAYNSASGQGPTTSVAVELAGRRLTPGIYGAGTLQINGTLTLDTLGNPNAVFIFKSASTLITGSGSNVVVANGATACNVYWRVASSATLGTGSHLVGSVLAAVSITATTAATIQGRLLAETGAVTLDTNTITRPVCAAATTTTTRPSVPRRVVAPTTSTQPAGTSGTLPGATPGATPVPGTPAAGTPGAPGTPGTPGSGTPPHLPTTL